MQTPSHPMNAMKILYVHRNATHLSIPLPHPPYLAHPSPQIDPWLTDLLHGIDWRCQDFDRVVVILIIRFARRCQGLEVVGDFPQFPTIGLLLSLLRRVVIIII
jgi:hypothetical protein